MFDLDINEQNILSISEYKDVLMEVHGETKTYRPIKNSDDSWDMNVVHQENAVYGLSCENIKELIALLLADYATGIITKVFF